MLRWWCLHPTLVQKLNKYYLNVNAIDYGLDRCWKLHIIQVKQIVLNQKQLQTYFFLKYNCTRYNQA